MVFNSFHFLLFFPVVVIGYFSIPYKVRYLWLLVASYYFYMCWNAKYALLMTTSILITYLSGLLITATRSTRLKKLWVALSFLSNLAILFFFKYYNFFGGAVNHWLESVGMNFTLPSLDLLLPVGISFYTFQALSYTVDVYRGQVEVEKNPLRYALFVSFFPQLVAGPIERSQNLLTQLRLNNRFDYDRAKHGFVLMLGGFFKKVVIADRLAIFVNEVYNNCARYGAAALWLATLFFAFQIYCDFSGYSDIAIGCAKVMGYNLMKNFDRPYGARSIAEFWRKWHISLSTWFKDYLYIPLGGSRVSFSRWSFNTMVVFLTSGLWHGANWTYILWGGIHGIYQIIGRATRAMRDAAYEKLGIAKDGLFRNAVSTVVTFGLVCLAWVFFRANSLADALYILRTMVTFGGGAFELTEGMGYWQDVVLGGALIPLLLMAEHFLHRHGGNAWLQRRALPVRWLVYMVGILSVVLFGIYGSLTEASFIYFQF